MRKKYELHLTKEAQDKEMSLQVQSFIFTVARYDFNVYQKRFFYQLFRLLKPELDDQKLDKTYVINQDLLGDFEVQMPLKALLKGEEDKNHGLAVKALKGLQTKIFEYEDAEIIQLISLIYKPRIEKRKETFTCSIEKPVIEAILNFSKGFSKYDLTYSFNFKSVYAMRMYELMYSQKKSITFSIDYLREMFAVGTKYRSVNGFIEKTIGTAKKEIDASGSERTFNFKPNIGKYGKIESLTFTPVQTVEVKVKELMKTTSIRFDIEREVLKYLRDNFNFTEDGLKNNREVFSDAKKQGVDIMNLLAGIKAKANRGLIKKSGEGYVINALKIAIKNKNK